MSDAERIYRLALLICRNADRVRGWQARIAGR